MKMRIEWRDGMAHKWMYRPLRPGVNGYLELMFHAFDIPPRLPTEKAFDSFIVKTIEKLRDQ